MFALKLGAAAVALAAICAPAAATTITFNDLTTTSSWGLYQTVTENGLLFSNSYGSSTDFVVWGANEPYNADQGGATLGNDWDSTTTTVTRVGGGKFDLTSIDLGDVFNQGSGGQVRFDFNGDSAGTFYVDLDNLKGLQTFTFNMTGLISFSYTPLTTQGPWIQVDNVVMDLNQSSPAPEPASWALMLGGFGFVGSALRATKRRTQLTFA
jgi:hypothetical protein